MAEPARDVIIVADGGGGVPPLHDVVGVPTFGLGFDRAPETGQRRSHRSETGPGTAEPELQLFTQVRGEDVAFDERVAHDRDTDRSVAFLQFFIEGREAAVSRRVEIFDRDQRRRQPDRIRKPGLGSRIVRLFPEVPFVGGRGVLRHRVGDLAGDLRQVDVEIRIVQIDRFFGFFEVFFERDEVGQDVSPAQTDPAERLRRYQAQSDENGDEQGDGDPAPVCVVLFRGHQSRRPKIIKT